MVTTSSVKVRLSAQKVRLSAHSSAMAEEQNNNLKGEKQMTNLVVNKQYFLSECVLALSNDFDSTIDKIDSLDWINMSESDLENYLEIGEQVSGQSSIIQAKFWANAQDNFQKMNWTKKYKSFENYIKEKGRKITFVYQYIDMYNVVKNISSRFNGVKDDEGNFIKLLPIKERWTREILNIGRNNQDGQAEVWKRVVRKAKDLLITKGEPINSLNLQKTITMSMIEKEVERLWEQIKKENPTILTMFEKSNQLNGDVTIPSEDHLDVEEDNLVDVLTAQLEEEMNIKLSKLSQAVKSKQEDIAKKQEEFNLTKQEEIELAIQKEKEKIEKENAKKEKELERLTKQLELLQDSDDEDEIERIELAKAKKESQIKENEEKLQDYIEDKSLEIEQLQEELEKLNDPKYREQYLQEQLEQKLKEEKEKKLKAHLAQQKQLSANRKKQIDEYEKALDKAVRALDDFLIYTKKLTLPVLSYLRQCDEAQTSTLYSDRKRLESMVDKINTFLDDAFVNYTPNISSFKTEDDETDQVIDVKVA